MKREIAIIGMIVCIAVGFVIGFFIPGLFAPAPGKSLVDKIEDRDYIIVGTSSDWPPFEIYNTTTKEYEGFDIDLSDMIAEELGVTVQWSDMDFDALIGACVAGTIDMIAAAMMVRPDRAEQLAHSVPYIRTNMDVIVLGISTLNITKLEDLKPHKVGCQTGTVQQDELEAVGITPVKFPRADVMIADLVAGQIDAAFVDTPVLNIYSKTENLKSIFTVPAEPTALWCSWDEPELMKVINKVILEAFADGTIDDLITKWFE